MDLLKSVYFTRNGTYFTCALLGRGEGGKILSLLILCSAVEQPLEAVGLRRPGQRVDVSPPSAVVTARLCSQLAFAVVLGG